mmetsp:Transcript_29270/g.70139  ORF Transcript_29270/g.70139 Transcript_29270/m.70139 type:complete len:392 (+) Transcript_29270:898-2073(+)
MHVRAPDEEAARGGDHQGPCLRRDGAPDEGQGRVLPEPGRGAPGQAHAARGEGGEQRGEDRRDQHGRDQGSFRGSEREERSEGEPAARQRASIHVRVVGWRLGQGGHQEDGGPHRPAHQHGRLLQESIQHRPHPGSAGVLDGVRQEEVVPLPDARLHGRGPGQEQDGPERDGPDDQEHQPEAKPALWIDREAEEGGRVRHRPGPHGFQDPGQSRTDHHPGRAGASDPCDQCDGARIRPRHEESRRLGPPHKLLHAGEAPVVGHLDHRSPRVQWPSHRVLHLPHEELLPGEGHLLDRTSAGRTCPRKRPMSGKGDDRVQGRGRAQARHASRASRRLQGPRRSQRRVLLRDQARWGHGPWHPHHVLQRKEGSLPRKEPGQIRLPVREGRGAQD